MITIEGWERRKLEEEIKYQLQVFRDLGERLPEEHLLVLKRGGRPLKISFLLIQSPQGLAYESLERVVLLPETLPLVFMPGERPSATAWRILL